MIIEKIDERTVAPGMDVSPLLNFKAGKPTALSIFDPAKDSRFVVSMKPIALGELEALLYERWVKQRRDLVDKLSNGTIGYTHVARMVDGAYRDTVSEALGRQVDKRLSSSTPDGIRVATCMTHLRHFSAEESTSNSSPEVRFSAGNPAGNGIKRQSCSLTKEIILTA
jgi:hypothetical protein